MKMKIFPDEIGFYESFWLFPIREKFVFPSTKALLHLLIHDNFFKRKTVQLRKKAGVSESGLLVSNFFKAGFLIEGISLEVQEEMVRISRIEDEEYTGDGFSPEQQKRVDKLREKVNDDQYEQICAFTEKELDVHKRRRHKIDVFEDYFRIWKLCFDDILLLTKHYKLPIEYIKPFFSLIFYNSFSNPLSEENRRVQPHIFSVSGREDLLKETSDMPDEESHFVSIIIPRKITKTSLINWINVYWKDLREDLERLPGVEVNANPDLLAKASEIIELKRKTKMSYKDLSLQLSDKYPDDSRIMDIGWMKSTVSRYHKILKEVAKGNLPL